VFPLRTEPTDEELMIRFAGGDRSSLALLVRRHKTRLYNFTLRQLGNGPAAEQLVLDAFVRVVERAADFKLGTRFSTWLYTLARGLCVDQLENSRRIGPPLDQAGSGLERDVGGLNGHPGYRANAERPIASVEIRERVLAAVDALALDQREVFLMREVGYLPFKDIAQVVGVPENAVKSRMRAALEHLQSELREFEEYARALR
jgi:RNA polymerase sigma-70 factor (ECF subfamily)